MSGRLFNIPSISITKVSKVSTETHAFPRVILIAFFVSPIKRSHHPPNHGALFGMNFHSVPTSASFCSNVLSRFDLVIRSAAALKVVALSEIIILGVDRLAAKRRKASRKVSSVRSVTISKCSARVASHVNKHKYLLDRVVPLLERSSVRHSP